jgi:hypothetical protein
MVELWLKSNTTDVWENIDVGADLTIGITKSYEEIEDFQTKKSTYSKTFTIPRTAKNNQFFASSFQVNSAGFENDIVVPAVVKYGGADVFNGSCRLNKVITSLNGGYFEVFLTQILPDFANSIQDVKLIELDYSGLTHTLNYDTLVSTWAYSGGSYNDYPDIVGKIVYPLGFYGYSDTDYYSPFNTSSTGFTSSQYPLAVGQFAPWVSAKYLIDKIFDRAGYSYTSSFFNSEYFAGIFCLAKTNNTQGATKVSAATQNENIFEVSQGRPTYIDTDDDNYNINYNKSFIFQQVINNPLNVFTRATSFLNRQNYFTTAVAGKYQFKIGFTLQLRDNYLPVTYLNIAIKDIDNGTIYREIQGIAILQGQPTEFKDIYMNATIPAGRRVALCYSRQLGGGDPHAQILISAANWKLYASPILSADRKVLLQDNLPNEMYCLEFFKGIVDTFNLVVIPKGQDELLVERWEDYFAGGDDLDWSQKLDLSTDYLIEPTNNLTKEYILKYKDSSDRYSLINQQRRNQQFGTLRNISSAQFQTGKKIIEVPFEPLPISVFDGETPSTILVPHIYTWNQGASSNTAQYTPLGSNIRLGFYNGLLDSKITGTTTPYYILSGTSGISHTTYAAISHLSSYEYSPSIFSDLNFQNQYDYWQPMNDSYIGFTNNDIFNNFWRTRVEQLYASDVKLFTGTFKLTPTEINNISFNDNVYFLNAWWRLLSMTDADITDISKVECKFIKLPYITAASIPLIPPTYKQAPFVPTPTPSSAPYQYVVFSSQNIGEMCNETAGQIVVWSNCSPTLSAGCSVFQDSAATTPYSEGTLIKQTGNNTIYQVIEYGIITIFTEC